MTGAYSALVERIERARDRGLGVHLDATDVARLRTILALTADDEEAERMDLVEPDPHDRDLRDLIHDAAAGASS